MIKAVSFKRILPVIVVASLASLALLAGCSCTPSDETAKDEAIVEEEAVVVVPDNAVDVITKADAKDIALNDAGVLEADAKQLQVTENKLDGVPVYEVDFTFDGVEYDYVIDAETGAILETVVETVVDMDGSAAGSADDGKDGSAA